MVGSKYGFAILKPEYSAGWNKVQCVDNNLRPTDARIGTLIDSAIPKLNTTALQGGYTVGGTVPAGGGGGSAANAGCIQGDYKQGDGSCLDSFGSTYTSRAAPSGTCSSGYSYYENSGGEGWCQNPNNPEDWQYYNEVTPVSQEGRGDCSPSAMNAFGSQAQAMSCIAQAESACIADRASQSDRSRVDGTVFSSGLYQINISANYMQCAGYNNGARVNCPEAFNGRNYNATIRNGALYTTCITMANNRECATETAQRILNNQGIKAWSTAAGCGY
jgi:hypothetical protein